MKRGFVEEGLSKEDIEKLKEMGKLLRGDVLRMTTVAGSGHPGGSISSLDIYLILYSYANITPNNLNDPRRDRVIVSHGHTASSIYAVLARFGFFSLKDLIPNFRKADSPFEGHVTRGIPGIEWTSGNLGQGLSAGCGFAIAARIKGLKYRVFVVMGDGEQQKGQVQEARRFAKKYGLDNLCVIVDKNGLQISDEIENVMPQDIAGEYKICGWKVLEIDGHNYNEIYKAIRKFYLEGGPFAIIANTTMGGGVPAIDGKREYHGKALTKDECEKALSQIGLDPDLEPYFKERKKKKSINILMETLPPRPDIDVGRPFTYKATDSLDNRTAFGNVLFDIAKRTKDKKNPPIAVFDCDLAPSVKVEKFAQILPDNFFESGIQEHHTATMAGAVSLEGILSVFADFGVFGIDEVYNQMRLNDINRTNLKLVCTHLGLNVGEDGKTHHCTDYLGLLRNLYDFKVIIPADPNQCDRVVRYAFSEIGNFFIGMGRSKDPIICDLDGNPFFGDDYQFEYGKPDFVRDGDMGAILTYGPMLKYAIEAWERLYQKGIALSVINVSSPLYVDKDLLFERIKGKILITYEDHNVYTGLGSVIGDLIGSYGTPFYFKKLGIKGYAGSASAGDLYKQEGLLAENLIKEVMEMVEIARKGI